MVLHQCWHHGFFFLWIFLIFWRGLTPWVFGVAGFICEHSFVDEFFVNHRLYQPEKSPWWNHRAPWMSEESRNNYRMLAWLLVWFAVVCVLSDNKISWGEHGFFVSLYVWRHMEVHDFHLFWWQEYFVITQNVLNNFWMLAQLASRLARKFQCSQSHKNYRTIGKYGMKPCLNQRSNCSESDDVFY